jgi:hypothetical protein
MIWVVHPGSGSATLLMGMQYLQLVARREAADRTTAELHKQKEELARVRKT